MTAVYDTMGKSYARHRPADPRIALAIEQALIGCVSILNVGAGSGSYELPGSHVVAVEPSKTMIGQRPANAAPAVQARAEALPFASRSFDAVVGMLTLHHWHDPAAGIAECLRVARNRVVYLTVDPDVLGQYWLFDYLPSLWVLDRPLFSNLSCFSHMFTSIKVLPLSIPQWLHA